MNPAAPADLIPFNLIEDFWRWVEGPRASANLHCELRFPRSIDEDRLRGAIAATVAAHPMARARRRPGRKLDYTAYWQVLDRDELSLDDILHTVQCQTESELDALRGPFFSRHIDIQQAPGLRLLLAQRPDGDSLLFSMNHTICDGVGAYRVLLSIARAYTGAPDPLPPIDPIAARELKSDDFKTAKRAGRRPARAKGRAARIHPPAGDRDIPGVGFQHVALSEADTRSLEPQRLARHATFNDLLLAALLRAVADWNDRYGVPPAPIVLHAPFNLRPAAWRNEVVANLSLSGELVVAPEHLVTEEATVAAVLEQRRWLKAGAMARLQTPRWAQYAVVRAMPVLKRWMTASAILTNLGRLDPPLDFGPAGEATEIWVSGAIGMPTGLL
ncbi:MAG TPA: hypothetical protein VFI42_17380, partial [Thermomicrobiaceae bacterium]|nr:hypothetical protein [Thermomicrobiaceae bacterium]